MTTEAILFNEFPKIARFSRDVIVTEKIDGTNACVYIDADGHFLTGSRSRWITPEDDNFGFSRWAHDHKADILTLGPGQHFGEWWGSGIQRGYGLPKGEKRFSLFNVSRWCAAGQEPQRIPTADPRVVKMQDVLPSCVGLVPVIWRGLFDCLPLPDIMRILGEHGSYAAPGFMQPEGVVIFHVAGCLSFKKTIAKDGEPKGRP